MNFNQKRQKSKSSRTNRLLLDSSTRHFMIFYAAAVGAVIAYFFLQRHYFFSQNPWKWFSETEAETVKRSLTREKKYAVLRRKIASTYKTRHIAGLASACSYNQVIDADNAWTQSQRTAAVNVVYTLSASGQHNQDTELRCILTGSNKNTSEWKVDKQKLPNTYVKVMVSFAFAMEGLKFDSIKKQEVLLLGLGGGVVANFLSTLKKAKIYVKTFAFQTPVATLVPALPNIIYANFEMQLKMTSIELDPTVRDVAVKWFGLEENDMHKTIVADGAKFVREEAKKGKQYRAILLDACYSTCPMEVFLESEVVESIAHTVDKDGVLAINVLTDPVRNIEKINEILKVYKIHFASCFYFYIDLQQVLLCSHRRGWTFDEQMELFTKKLEEIDRKFGFRFT